MEIPFNAHLNLIKAYEDKDGEFHVVGYAATKDFDIEGDVISIEAMEASSHDLLKNSTVLYNHNPDAPIGKVTTQDIDKKGTLVDVVVDKSSVVVETGAKIVDLIKQGILNKFSISAKVLDSTREFVEEIGRTANVIKRMLLFEVSLVSVPANPEAKALEWYVSKALTSHREGDTGMKKQDVKKDATVKALTHNSDLEEGAPAWGDVDKGKLPANAFVTNAPDIDLELKSTWSFPHHWVKDGGELAENGIFTSGDLFLHREGLTTAWTAAQADDTPQEIVRHLDEHRKAIGLDADDDDDADKDKDKPPAKDDTKKDNTDEGTPAPKVADKVDKKVEDEVQKKLERNKGGFPAPDALATMWGDYCKANKVSKNTDAVEVKEHWVTFCKDNEMPEGYAYPYPNLQLSTVDSIVIIAEDLMKNEDDIIVGLGSELKTLIVDMLAEEVPMPDFAASKKPDDDDVNKDTDPDVDKDKPPAKDDDVQKNLQTDTDKDKKPPEVKRKGIVDDPETGKKTDTLEKQMEGMDPQERLNYLTNREGQAMGRQ